jgi:hypothetical protein
MIALRESDALTRQQDSEPGWIPDFRQTLETGTTTHPLEDNNETLETGTTTHPLKESSEHNQVSQRNGKWWTDAEDALLLAKVKRRIHPRRINIQGRTPKSCERRYQRLMNKSPKRPLPLTQDSSLSDGLNLETGTDQVSQLASEDLEPLPLCHSHKLWSTAEDELLLANVRKGIASGNVEIPGRTKRACHSRYSEFPEKDRSEDFEPLPVS